MEPNTSKVSPPTVKVDWKDPKPYVEVWDGEHLVLAGWVYPDRDMIRIPPAVTLGDPNTGHIEQQTVHGWGNVVPVEPYHGKTSGGL